MHLKKIKLAGFKSFVEPTTVHFRSKIAAVVGPNGCGKSNIIDAVRWVMGESSAKQLRGTSMADVIFNGSAQRKPLGQASIELTFDNSDAGIGGEYAQYNEIAVRREIGRDGVSAYYLNGTHCRRRDIIDIFLGTGLGPNSYAIIEQGTISQFVEAKPDELRLYLEEAAGISKYKERRRETENRIRHTRDNLARLNDIRTELEQQLQRLKTQANAAERYKKLKHEERRTKAELQTLHWQHLQQQLCKREELIVAGETQLENKNLEQHQCDAKISLNREQHHEIAEVFNAVQESFYRMGADIARLEQQLQHDKERKQHLVQELAKLEQTARETTQHQQQDQAQFDLLQGELNKIGDTHPEAMAELQQAEQKLQQEEYSMRQHTQAWEELNVNVAHCDRNSEVTRTKMQHIEQTIASEEQRLQKMRGELASFTAGDNNQTEISNLQEVQYELQEQSTALHEDAASKQEAIEAQRKFYDKLKAELDVMRHKLQVLAGKRASLESLQEAALGKSDALQQQWLQEKKLHEKPRLLEELQVTTGWERAVETALAGYLEAICVEDIALAREWQSLPDSHTVLFNVNNANNVRDDVNLAAAPSTSSAAPALSALSTLLSKIENQAYCVNLLAGIYVAPDLAAALATRASLAPYESIITQDGIWLGVDWLALPGKAALQSGAIQRERELKELIAHLCEQESVVAQREMELQRQQAVGTEFEQQHHALQHKLREVMGALGKIQGEIGAKQKHATYLEQRQQSLQQEILQHENNVAATRVQLASVKETWEETLQQKEEWAERRIAAQQEKEQLQQRVQAARDEVMGLRKRVDAHVMRQEMLQTQLKYLQSNLERAAKKLDEVESERTKLEHDIGTCAAPVVAKEQELQDKLKARFVVEQELQAAKLRVSASESALSELEERRAQLQDEMQALRQKLETLRLEAQELKTKKEGYVAQIVELGYELSELLRALSGQGELIESGDRLGESSKLNALNESESGAQSVKLVEDNEQSSELIADGEVVVGEGNEEAVQPPAASVSTSLDVEETEKSLSSIALSVTPAMLEEWEKKLAQLTARIERLGAINLAAIDEFTKQSERKTYLDVQHQDLVDALETLENAIRKIDRETKEKFHGVFNEVNQKFSELFPNIFGGGKAYLELFGDDLLESGVAIFAQPPGKRNSSIHLLSGGEKALTAIALIFAIFQRNPAPFCILDEVDAPLDDTNVARFCNLIKQIAASVQLIFISHNKLTLEIADQLTGVTMQEPGVSRIVEVDVQQALEWVEKR